MMIEQPQVEATIQELSKCDTLVVDTETTGLRPYHEDVLFSIIIGTLDDRTFYFNFNNYPGVDGLRDFGPFQRLFSLDKTWVFHNAKFDLAFLEKEGIHPQGTIVDTMVMGRLDCNDHFSYSLADMGQRIGVEKSNSVEEYIAENKLWSWENVPGMSKRTKNKRYNEVPLDIIVKYGVQDVVTTTAVYKNLVQSLQSKDIQSPANRPKFADLVKTENSLVKVLFDMERTGVKIDREYCELAKKHYEGVIYRVKSDFLALTGHVFSKGTILFKELFKNEKWIYTEKGNPKFDAAALKTFQHPAAGLVLKYAEAKKQLEYFDGFLYQADSKDIIHTNFKQSGTITGRLSSSSPNLQNLTSKDKYEKADDKLSFTPRAAFVPRDGYFFAMLDYQQAEYRAMLDMADCDGLIDKVLAGTDVHQATADVSGVSRKEAKTVNFLTLYGGGIKTLSSSLGVSEDVARKTQESIFRAAPEIRGFIRRVIRVAETRKYIFNVFGRHSHFPNPNFSYKAPNHLIQGLCADICKQAMVEVFEYLQSYKSRLLLTIHDELVFEIAYGEEHILPELGKIMADVYQYKKLPQGVDIEYSTRDLASKEEWHGEKRGDSIQRVGTSTIREATQHMGREDTASGYQGNA